MYVACGTEVFAYEGYLKFQGYAKAQGIDAEFEEIEGYKHEWRFWDITIQHIIKYFGINRKE